MSELISGKESLIALANGKEVQIWNGNIWWDVEGDYQINVFLKTERNFRIKPRTITLNGIEVPACGSDYKPHTCMFVLNSLDLCEYSKITLLDESDEAPPYWWRTEEEVKQVVAALRSVFSTK